MKTNIIKYFGFIALTIHLTACDVIDNDISEDSSFSTPRGRYSYSANGKEIKDIKTGLIWQTCQVGQKWNGNTCVGEAKKFTQEQAMSLDTENWRTPSIRELVSLIKCSSGEFFRKIDVGDGGDSINTVCDGDYIQPTIDIEAFPNTPDSCVWSHSMKKNDNAGDTPTWYVCFSHGSAEDSGTSNINGHGDYFGVRLVRRILHKS